MSKQARQSGERREISYIVRVYRCDSDGIAGVVEMPVQERRSAFRSFAELQAILTGTFSDRASLRNRRTREG